MLVTTTKSSNFVSTFKRRLLNDGNNYIYFIRKDAGWVDRILPSQNRVARKTDSVRSFITNYNRHTKLRRMGLVESFLFFISIKLIFQTSVIFSSFSRQWVYMNCEDKKEFRQHVPTSRILKVKPPRVAREPRLSHPLSPGLE